MSGGPRREICHHDLVSALNHPVRNGLADRNAGDALHGGCDALDMLDVHGRQYINARGQHVEHVFVAFSVLTTLDVRVRKLVDQNNLRMAGENAVKVHLLKGDAFVFDLCSRIFSSCSANSAVRGLPWVSTTPMMISSPR